MTYPESGTYKIDSMKVSADGETRSSRAGDREGPILDGQKLQDKAIHMVRGLIALCSSFSPLPEDRTISMMLFYYDSITPPDYEPEFFKSTPRGVSHFKDKNFCKEALSLHLGSLSSRFHCLSMKVKAREDNISEDDRGRAERDEEEPVTIVDEDDLASIEKDIETDDPDNTVVNTKPLIVLSQKNLNRFDEECEETQLVMTADTECRDDKDFEELPPWRRDKIDLCRAIIMLFDDPNFQNVSTVTNQDVADVMNMTEERARFVLDVMSKKRLVAPRLKMNGGGFRILRNMHSRSELKIAKAALAGKRLKSPVGDQVMDDVDEECTQVHIDDMSVCDPKSESKARRSRLYGEHKTAPFLRPAPSPRSVPFVSKGREKSKYALLPPSSNMTRKRIHGADWLRGVRELNGVSRTETLDTSSSGQLTNKRDRDDNDATHTELHERITLSQSSQDSVFSPAAITRRKVSSVCRPIHQYGRKKRRRHPPKAKMTNRRRKEEGRLFTRR